MRQAPAGQKGITQISDLAGHPELVLAFSMEFLNREDGWPGLVRTYNLPGHPQASTTAWPTRQWPTAPLT